MRKRYKVEVVQTQRIKYTNNLMEAKKIAVDALLNIYKPTLVVRVNEETFKAPEFVYIRTNHFKISKIK